MQKTKLLKQANRMGTKHRTKKGPSTKRQPLSEAIKQQAALHKKYKEYSLLSIEELNELYPILGGNYREVCFQVIKEKHFVKMEQDLEGEVK
jgi:hypothetical protein